MKNHPLRIAARQCLFAALITLAPLLGADEAPADAAVPPVEPPPVFQAHITGGGWLSSLTGSLQTSAGGGAGTTSWNRPELDEIGLDGLHVLPTADAGIILFDDHELRVNYVGIDIAGTATLTEELISQGKTFPAGADAESKLELDIIRIGYQVHWLPLDIGEWSLAPEGGMIFAPFRYRLDSAAVPKEVDRGYSFGFPYLALQFEGPLVGDLRGEIDLAGSYGINGATYCDLDLRISHRLVTVVGIDATAVLGLRGTILRRRDHQSPQFNDIKLRMGSFSSSPWAGLTFGLRLSF